MELTSLKRPFTYSYRPSKFNKSSRTSHGKAVSQHVPMWQQDCDQAINSGNWGCSCGSVIVALYFHPSANLLCLLPRLNFCASLFGASFHSCTRAWVGHPMLWTSFWEKWLDRSRLLFVSSTRCPLLPCLHEVTTQCLTQLYSTCIVHEPQTTSTVSPRDGAEGNRHTSLCSSRTRQRCCRHTTGYESRPSSKLSLTPLLIQ